MGKSLDYYFDYLSSFTYLANTQLPGIVERTGAEVSYRRRSCSLHCTRPPTGATAR